MNRTPRQDLIERLKDPEYAKLYGEEDAKVDFAVTLTKVRKSLNFTQKSLADKLGVSQPYVAKLEGGEANPTLGRIGALLAMIDRRLVTQTAPLTPKQVSPFIEYLESADASFNITSLDYESIHPTEVGYTHREAIAGGTI
jgi:transcriptional regulator with XRE-family HTH domain